MKPVLGLLLIAGGLILLYGLMSNKILFPLGQYGGSGGASFGNSNPSGTFSATNNKPTTGTF